jgi:YD repeat-containing protein
MKKFKLSVLVLISLFQYTIVFSQAQTPPIKDPHLEAFSIFGDIPVSHSTGVPDISIPLFNLESHGYTLPVTLRYHTALVKAPYDQTNVATGWILEVGGNIVQTINNADDFLGRRPAAWKNDYDLSDQNAESTWSYTHMAVSGSYDCEYDIFSYSIPDSNGKFIVNKNTTGKYDAVFLSDPNLKGNIDITADQYNYSVNNFIITDKNGYNYKFLQKSNFNTPFYMLDKLYSPNGLELFSFEYSNIFNYVYGSNYIGFRHYVLPISTEVIKGIYQYISPSANLYSYFVTGLSPESWEGTTIKKVVFDNGSLVFNLDASTNNRYIKGVCLRDNNGILKNIEFEIGNFPGSGYRYLNKILIKDANQIISEYSFDYYHKDRTVSNSTLNLDYFGYLTWGSRGLQGKFIDIEPRTFDYIRSTSSGNFQDQITIGTGENKKPDLEYAQTYALKSITYPTKGRTEFVYGLNQYFDATTNTTENGGGIRVEKITNYDENNKQVSVKTYQYGPGEVDFNFHDSGDNFKMTYEFGGFYDIEHHSGYLTKTRVQHINHNIINPEVSKDVRYGKVTEFFGTLNGNNGKTTYEYRLFNPHVYSWLDVSYNGQLYGGDNPWRYIYEYRDWENAQLTKKTVFKNNSGAYDTVLTEKLTYTKTDLQSFDNLKFFNYANYNTSSVGNNYSTRYLLINENNTPPENLPPPYIPYSYTIKAGAIRLTSKVTTLYNNDGSKISSNEIFNFDQGMGKFMTSREVTNSDSKVTKTFFKYPYNVSSDVTNEMVTRNILSPVLEETSEVGSLKVKGTKTNYGFLNADGSLSASSSQVATAFILPSENYELDENENYYKKYTYDRYNNENLLQIHKESDINTSYIWGYNQTYPVAKIEGKAISDIAATIRTGIGSHSFSGSTSYADINTDVAWLKAQLTTLLSDKTCMVTIYTYAPLIGMTSSTNPSGVTTYYEYDTFGRLKCLRDDDGHILKTYEYHYQQ